MGPRPFFALYLTSIVFVVNAALLACVIHSREQLKVIGCSFDERDDLIFVEVENFGTADIWIEDILVNHAPLMRILGDGYKIDAGKTLKFPVNYDWSSNEHYSIQVVTAKGNVAGLLAEAPVRQPPLEIENIQWNSIANTTSILIKNVGTRERDITRFFLLNGPSEGEGWEVTKYTDIGTGKLVHVSQSTTITLNWPNACAGEGWASGRTYFFTIYPEWGPLTEFTSVAPPRN